MGSDYFALLRQPRKPWLPPDKLEEEYQRLAMTLHPDRQKEGRRTASSDEATAARKAPPTLPPATFADVNQAYQALSNPRLRLKHLLTLEGNAPAPAAAVPMEVADLFAETGALVRDIDGLLEQMSAATTVLNKSLLRPQLLDIQERTNAFLKRLEALYQKGVEDLKQLDAAWEDHRDKVIEELATLYRRFAYLERWIDQLRERQFQLSSQ